MGLSHPSGLRPRDRRFRAQGKIRNQSGLFEISNRKWMAGSGNGGNRQPKFPICTNPDVRRHHFDVLRHGGVKIETYSVAQAGENQNRLRSVDAASYTFLRSKIYVWDVPSATANQRVADNLFKIFDFYTF